MSLSHQHNSISITPSAPHHTPTTLHTSHSHCVTKPLPHDTFSPMTQSPPPISHSTPHQTPLHDISHQKPTSLVSPHVHLTPSPCLSLTSHSLTIFLPHLSLHTSHLTMSPSHHLTLSLSRTPLTPSPTHCRYFSLTPHHLFFSPSPLHSETARLRA